MLRRRSAFTWISSAFTSPWRYEEGGRVRVAQVDRLECTLILSDQWPQKTGKALMFVSLNVEPALHNRSEP
jgi:hypothetical protein